MDTPEHQLKMQKVTINYLILDLATQKIDLPNPIDGLQIVRAHQVPVPFYRFLYNTVGHDWLWYERRLLNDKELGLLLHHPNIHLHILYRQGVPLGYSEIGFHHLPVADLLYFGLMPWAIGQGLGSWLLNWSIHYAQSHQAQKIAVNTCTLDHPSALTNYMKAGLKVVRQESKKLDIKKIRQQMNAYSVTYNINEAEGKFHKS